MDADLIELSKQDSTLMRQRMAITLHLNGPDFGREIITEFYKQNSEYKTKSYSCSLHGPLDPNNDVSWDATVKGYFYWEERYQEYCEKFHEKGYNFSPYIPPSWETEGEDWEDEEYSDDEESI